MMNQVDFTNALTAVRKANGLTEANPQHYQEKDYEQTLTKLNSIVCYDSVQYYTYLCGVFYSVPAPLFQNTPELLNCFFTDESKRITTESQFKDIGAGKSLVFTGVDGQGNPRDKYVSHVMVSLGTMLAMGSNNSVITKLSADWEQVNLNSYIVFKPDGTVGLKTDLNQRMGWLYATMLKDIKCKCKAI